MAGADQASMISGGDVARLGDPPGQLPLRVDAGTLALHYWSIMPSVEELPSFEDSLKLQSTVWGPKGSLAEGLGMRGYLSSHRPFSQAGSQSPDATGQARSSQEYCGRSKLWSQVLSSQLLQRCR
jgi:hypothetical protein